MNKKTPIQFHFLSPCTLGKRGLLKKFILSIFKKEKKKLDDLKVIFCDDNYLLALNRQFLNHDFYTDILSFPLSAMGQPLKAEIYISVDRVRENAQCSGSTFKNEIHRVIFHGILHFCGYRDKTTADIKIMRIMEERYLQAYF